MHLKPQTRDLFFCWVGGEQEMAAIKYTGDKQITLYRPCVRKRSSKVYP